MINLTQRYLKEILFYSPETGVFTWRVSRSRTKEGTIAGYLIKKGYRIITIDKKRYLASRLAYLYMKGRFPREEMDHKNRVRDDNRWNNLREVSSSGNSKNRSLRIDNSSGVAGVRWNEVKKKWRVTISHVHLGYFKNKLEAIQVRHKAEEEYELK